MPAVKPKTIIQELVDAIQQSGGVAAFVSETIRSNPRKFILSYRGETYSLWVYIWTLTPGGRPSLPDEYRIQMTSVKSPLPLNPNGMTVLMGYHPDLRVFAGFDLGKHRHFTAGSPSVQINISALHGAIQNGLSFSKKDNDEIAIGVRFDQFINYCLNAEALHRYGLDEKLINILNKATTLQKIEREDLENLAADRRKVIESVQRYSRDANFRRLVINAYEYRCAVTRIQLRLIDAAHILPVPAEKSSDHVTNGIALSPTFHRAYDNCLIYLDEEYIMRLNEEKVEELRAANLIGGLDVFRKYLNKKIHLPLDPQQHPRIEYIRKANKYRRIPGYY